MSGIYERLANSTLISDVENPNKMYLCQGNIRYIFEEGKYVGWYNPELGQEVFMASANERKGEQFLP